jgi:cellobiose phosphorylase
MISDLHKCEPYVYAQMISGRDAPIQGEAKNSWLTGTAAWNYVAISQWILGIRPSYTGLEIAPVIPDGWKGFDATRKYRGVRYEIRVERIGPGNKSCIEVGGQPVSGSVVPIPAAGVEQVRVHVKVGE